MECRSQERMTRTPLPAPFLGTGVNSCSVTGKLAGGIFGILRPVVSAARSLLHFAPDAQSPQEGSRLSYYGYIGVSFLMGLRDLYTPLDPTA